MSDRARSFAQALAPSPSFDAAAGPSGPPPAYAEVERPGRARTSAGVSVSVRPVADHDNDAIELSERPGHPGRGAPSRSKRPNSPPAPAASVPAPAPAVPLAALLPPAPPRPPEAPLRWNRPVSHEVAGYTFERRTIQRRCSGGKSLLLAAVATGVIVAIIGYNVYRQVNESKDNA